MDSANLPRNVASGPGPRTGEEGSAPFDPPSKKGVSDVWELTKAGLDFVAHNLPFAHTVLSRLNPYPSPWEAVEVPGEGGIRLAGVFGPGRPGGPVVLFAPGTFQTKDDTSRKRRALHLWRHFGAHVLVLDLRGFGGSHQHQGTGGYLESRDLSVAADWLRERVGVERVTLWGESLGGASALLAGCHDGAAGRFDRILAWSPYAEWKDASRIASATHPRGRSLPGRMYRWLLRVRTHRHVRDIDEYVAKQAAEFGITVDALRDAASPIVHMANLAVPAYVYHAENDPIVPVSHAYQFVGVGQPLLHVDIVPRGDHLLFDRVAPAWFESIAAYHFQRGGAS